MGNRPAFAAAAREVGQLIAQAGLALVYGGAKVGLMGAVADGALAAGGRVIGVLPHFLAGKEIAHPGLTELVLVESMHERKTRMHEISDAVITLPGGFGTLDEYFEMLTWAQLDLHRKPIGLLNVEGFYDGLLQLADTMVATGLLRQSNRDMMLADTYAARLLEQLRQWRAQPTAKWL